MQTQFISNQNMTGDIGEGKEKGFFEKAKEYKKEIAIGAALVISVVVAGLVVKNNAALKSAIKSSRFEEILTTNSTEVRNSTIPLISESASKNVTSNLPVCNIINVREHVRNLPEGRHPSINKVELAEKYGYSLEKHQTLVKAHTRLAA